ncbi:cell division trigger factor [alpha proteobacterium U9-1i]|nr:cell division trigger factor [alpha proteobacterium U9-1i]
MYDVVVPASELEQKLKAKIAEVQPRVRINGFRPGKVPVAHIRKVYGAGMMQDIINETVQSSTRESLDKAKARPASEPTLDLKSDIAKVTAGEADLAFEVSLEVMPEFEPADLKSIAITRPTAPVSDEQVDEELGVLAKANQTYEETDRAAKDGDQVTLDFVGKIDGEAFDGGAMTDAIVVIGAKQFIPGFEDELVGVKAGDTKVLNVTFPADYGAQHLAGKAAQFESTIKKVSAPKEGGPDDAWAQSLGLESLKAVKDLLRQRLESNHTQQSRMKAKRALFDKLDELHDFDLPPRMLEAEFQQIWRQVDADRVAGRLDPTDQGKSEDELKTEYRKIAERRVRLGLLLAEIGRRHKIEVSDQEVAQEIAKIARGYPGQERQIFEMYQKNAQLVATARAPLYEDKVVNYVLELIKVTDETVSREHLFADDDPEIAAVAKGEAKKPKKSKAKAEAKAED